MTNETSNPDNCDQRATNEEKGHHNELIADLKSEVDHLKRRNRRLVRENERLKQDIDLTLKNFIELNRKYLTLKNSN